MTKHRNEHPYWRWFTGYPLDGKFRTNANWTHRGTELRWPHPVTRWHYMPWLQRGLIRTGGTVFVPLVAWALLEHSTATIGTLATLAALFVGYLGWRVYGLIYGWKHYWTWHRPLHKAISKELAVPAPSLDIKRDRSRVVVGLPDEWTGSDKEREAITRAVTTKLAIEAPDTRWKLDHGDGEKPQVVYTRSQPPPERVTLADILPRIRAAAEHEIVKGIGRKDLITVVSVDNDSPHMGLSMGSGDGKSTVAKNDLAQILYHGGLGLILDYKLISHMWARGLPNVSYAGTPAEIEEALVWLAGEVTRRNQVALAGADIEGHVHASVGPRIFVIAEELNATQNRLKAWWNREMGEKGRSPGSEALDEVMFLGRQVHINVLQIGQRLSVKASGSGDARENLGVLVFADPTASAWKMLVGDRHVMPPASGHRGRLQVVTRREVRETQGAFLTGAEARQLATAGVVALPPAGMPCVTAVAPVPVAAGAIDSGPDQPFVVRQVSPVTPAPPTAVTLREAAEAGMWPSKDAAARAVQRAGLASAGWRGAAKLYDLTDLYVCLERKDTR